MSELDTVLLNYFNKYTSAKVSLDTELNNDLEFRASEVKEIIEFVNREFGCSFTEDSISQNFLPEDNVPLRYYYYKFFKPEKLTMAPYTIKDLIFLIKNNLDK